MERQHLLASCNSAETPMEQFLHSAVVISAAIRNPFLHVILHFIPSTHLSHAGGWSYSVHLYYGDKEYFESHLSY